MACEIISTRGAVFVLWGVPTIEDIDRVIATLRDAVRQVGEPVIYVTRVPVNQPAPSGDVRRHLDKLMPTLTQLFSSYHVVLEGDGFSAALKRAVLLGLFQLSWRRKTFFVHSVVGEIPSSLEKHRLAAFNQLVVAAKAQGLLDAEGPRSGREPAFANHLA
jgi:hypothetical protein